jgi:hypothetical protein
VALALVVHAVLVAALLVSSPELLSQGAPDVKCTSLQRVLQLLLEAWTWPIITITSSQRSLTLLTCLCGYVSDKPCGAKCKSNPKGRQPTHTSVMLMFINCKARYSFQCIHVSCEHLCIISKHLRGRQLFGSCSLVEVLLQLQLDVLYSILWYFSMS